MNARFFSMFLAIGVALGACGPSEEQYRARLREIQDLQGQLNTIRGERDRINEQLTAIRAQNETMVNRLRALGEDVSRLQTEGAATQRALEDTRRREAELRAAQQRAEQRLATFRQMIERFRAMINSGQLRVRIVRNRMVIELPAGILFESGQATLRPAGEEVLRNVAGVLRQIPDRDFLVAGHTDNVQLSRGGRFRDNWELSSARAVNVSRFLQETGVPAEHLGAAGHAEFQPAVPNDSDEHRQANRRVEIVLMPNINELPDLSSLDGPPAAAATTPAP